MDDRGRIVIATYPERAKTRNARRAPEQVSVLFLSDDFGGPWVQVDGTAEVLDVPEAVEALVDYYRSISGEHPDWADYREAMVTQGKSLLRITPVRWFFTRHRRLPCPPGLTVRRQRKLERSAPGGPTSKGPTTRPPNTATRRLAADRWILARPEPVSVYRTSGAAIRLDDV